MSSDRLIIILGSGPGIGVGVASHFASKGFNKIALLSRNADRLKEDAMRVESTEGVKGITVKTYTVDLAESGSLVGVLDEVEKELGVPEVVVYNASLLGGSKFFEVEEEEVQKSLQISALSLYTTAKWAIPRLTKLASTDPIRKPSLLVTSGGLYKSPFAPYFSLSLAKAAQFSLTQSLAQQYSKEGVHVAAVVVHGLVKPESEYFSPRKIAEVFWKLYEEGAEKGKREVWVEAPEQDEDSKRWRARALEG
ncbi:NAD(P)-binding protein [Tothia fuscella]|uniref:NAD(P)-binding protein n=1 Tax=Tothia fuscella TaxID=1048955 RepID=A0A9P4P581_9PEZI|nr:NAD(P)-binding protein [Tothia fuscella]